MNFENFAKNKNLFYQLFNRDIQEVKCVESNFMEQEYIYFRNK